MTWIFLEFFIQCAQDTFFICISEACLKKIKNEVGHLDFERRDLNCENEAIEVCDLDFLFMNPEVLLAQSTFLSLKKIFFDTISYDFWQMKNAHILRKHALRGL